MIDYASSRLMKSLSFAGNLEAGSSKSGFLRQALPRTNVFPEEPLRYASEHAPANKQGVDQPLPATRAQRRDTEPIQKRQSSKEQEVRSRNETVQPAAAFGVQQASGAHEREKHRPHNHEIGSTVDSRDRQDDRRDDPEQDADSAARQVSGIWRASVI
jgi:hypothetical protein